MRHWPFGCPTAAIAQLGERQTEDLTVPGSIPGLGMFAGGRVLHAVRGNKFLHVV